MATIVIVKKITKYNQSNKELKAIGGIQHSTGNGEDTAKANFNYFNSADRGANAHFFIDANNILQFVEKDKVAWHGRHPANDCMWGIEACETKDPEKFKEIWKKLVSVWGYLFASSNIRIVDINTLRSHDEENKINHAGDINNHVDPTTYFKKFGKNMDMLRNDVQKEVDRRLHIKTVTASVLNIRKEPKITNNNIVGKLSKGEKVQILGIIGIWAKINYNNQNAYVSTNYLA